MAHTSNLSCLYLRSGDIFEMEPSSWRSTSPTIPGCRLHSSKPCCPPYLVEQEWFRNSSRTFPVLLMAPSVSRKSSRGWPLWMGCRMTHFKGDKMLVPPISARILLMLSQAMARLSCPKEQRNHQPLLQRPPSTSGTWLPLHPPHSKSDWQERGS